MRFRLITLLAVVTISGVLIAMAFNRSRYQKRLDWHQTTFRALETEVSSLDAPLEKKLLSLPKVMEQLQLANPVDPKMALRTSVSGESHFYGRFGFKRRYTYSWPQPDGDVVDGIDILIESVIDDVNFKKHVVTLTYEPTEFNTAIAEWIESQLQREERAVILHDEPEEKADPEEP